MRPLNEIGEPIVAFAKAAVLDGKREVFPRWILEELASGRTPVAKATVAMPKPTPAMPVVAPPQPILAPKPSMANLNVQDVFHTDGTLLQVVLQEGTLRYLWFEDGRFFREGRRELLKNVALGPEWAYQIAGPGTLIARAGNTFLLDPPAQPQKVAASLYRGQQPAFTSNGKNYFWVEGPELMRNNTRAPLRLGQVLGGQTQIWAGNSFGFGYYEAGGLNSAFIFDAETQGLKPIELPLLHGSLLSVDCVLSDRRAWVLITIKERAKVVNHCFLIKSTGELLASATADKGEDNWLGTPGGLAAGHSSTECLFVATEDGVVDVTQAGSSLQANTIYRGTEGIVRPKDRILWSQEGLYVCSGKDIRLISTR